MPMMVFGVGGRGARAERQEDFASRHPGGVPDIGWVSVGAPVEHVGQVLGGAHGLFCDPPASCGSAASGAGSKLAGAGGFGALSYSGFRASGTEWFEGLGLSGVATHPTRATLATSLLNNDAPAALVSQLLGHISDESLAHYARYNEDHMVCHLGTGAAVNRPYR